MSLHVLRVRELTLSTPPKAPHVLTFYKMVLDRRALHSLSVRAEEAETVEYVCEFLPTFGEGLRSFTLDMHSYFDPKGAGKQALVRCPFLSEWSHPVT